MEAAHSGFEKPAPIKQVWQEIGFHFS